MGDSKISSTTNHPREERTLSAGLCRHRPPAVAWWADVPSVQWYFRGHGRTSPDLELSANRCAILHPRNPPISCCLSPPCPRHADRGCKGQWARLWPPGPGLCQPKRDGAGMGGLPTSQPVEPPSATATSPPLIWGPSCTYPPGLPSFDCPSHSTWADLSTSTCDPLFLLPSPVGSCFFPVSRLLGIHFLSFLYSNSVLANLVLTTSPVLLLDFHAPIAK